MEIQKWIRGLGYPESGKDITDLQLLGPGDIGGKFYNEGLNVYSDATLQILSNNLVPKFQVFFNGDDLFNEISQFRINSEPRIDLLEEFVLLKIDVL